MQNKDPLKVLILEENQSEIKLFESILFDSNILFESKHAKTENEFIKHVNRFKPDVILSGTNLTKYSVHEALLFLKEQELLIPFVLITGAIPEELAKDYLKHGVDEYLTKYNLLSLPAVIIKSVEIKKTIREKLKADQLNQKQGAELQTFFDNNPEAIFEIGYNCEFINANKVGKELLNLTESKLSSKKIKLFDFLEPARIKEFKESHSATFRGQKRNLIFQFVHNKGNPILLECKMLPLFDENQMVTSVLVIGINITESEKIKKSLKITKSNYENLISSIDEAMWSVDRDFKIVEFNEHANKLFFDIRENKLKIGLPLKDFSKDEVRQKNWEDRYQLALNGEKVCTEDTFIIGGEKVYAKLTFYPARVNDEIIGVSVLANDITSSKKIELELRQSEQVFRTLSENAPVGIFKIDDLGNCTYANEYFSSILLTDFESLKNQGWLNYIYEHERVEFRKALDEFVQSKTTFSKDVRLFNSKKETIWTKILISVIKSEDSFTGIGTVSDISNLKNAYDELLEKQTIISAIEHNSKIGFFVRDFNDESRSNWSDALYTIFEQNKNNGVLPFSKIIDFIHPDDRENLITAIKNVRNGGFANLAHRIVPPSGNVKHVLLSAFPIFDDNNTVIKMTGAVLDLTTITNKEIEFSNQKSLMSDAFEIANIGLWEHNVKDRTTIWSKETKRMFGLKSSDAPLSLEVYAALIHPDDRQGYLDFYNSQVLGAKQSSYEYRVFVRGDIRTHLTFSYGMKNSENKVEKMAGIIIDKTNSRKTENKLLASEKLFNSFFDNLPDAIFIEDKDGTILNVNKKACELQGLERSVLIGKNFTELVPATEKLKIMSDFKRMFSGEISEHHSQAFIITGEAMNIEINAIKISYNDIPAILLNVKKV